MMRKFLVCCVACGLVLCLASHVESMPQSRLPSYLWDRCSNSQDVLALCQKCATKSKSPIVYPMCCEAQEEAREWCYSFLTYGLQDPAMVSL